MLSRIVAWLREGYPAGVPTQDYVPLLALLRRRLTDEEVDAIAQRMVVEGLIPPDQVDIGVLITKITDEVPGPVDIERVRDHLAFRGFPVTEA